MQKWLRAQLSAALALSLWFLKALAAPPLAVRLSGALSEEQRQQVLSLVASARADVEAFALRGEGLVVNRSFGPGGTSHETLFLHRHLERRAPALRRQLLDLALGAERAAGWNLTRGVREGALRARCIELLTYQGGRHVNPVRWHGDGATLMTMVVMMSPPGSFEGGAVELRDYGNGLQ
ncbi:unnamed protein product, partial [Polarella glacialis]